MVPPSEPVSTSAGGCETEKERLGTSRTTPDHRGFRCFQTVRGVYDSAVQIHFESLKDISVCLANINNTLNKSQADAVKLSEVVLATEQIDGGQREQTNRCDQTWTVW